MSWVDTDRSLRSSMTRHPMLERARSFEKDHTLNDDDEVSPDPSEAKVWEEVDENAEVNLLPKWALATLDPLENDNDAPACRSSGVRTLAKPRSPRLLQRSPDATMGSNISRRKLDFETTGTPARLNRMDRSSGEAPAPSIARLAACESVIDWSLVRCTSSVRDAVRVVDASVVAAPSMAPAAAAAATQQHERLARALERLDGVLHPSFGLAAIFGVDAKELEAATRAAEEAAGLLACLDEDVDEGGSALLGEARAKLDELKAPPWWAVCTAGRKMQRFACPTPPDLLPPAAACVVPGGR